MQPRYVVLPMHRRQFLSTALAATALAACGQSTPVATGISTGSSARNLVFIVIDDLNDYVGYLGGYGGTVHTPSIDALATESARFNRAYVTVPVCSGSRASLLWGLSPQQHGITTIELVGEQPGLDLYNSAFASIPEHLGDQGITTMGAGKVFHEPFPPAWTSHGPTDWLPFSFGEHGTFFDYGPWDPSNGVHPDQAVADWAVSELQKEHDGQFLLAVGFNLPHQSWKCPQSYFDLYPLEEVVLPATVPDDHDDLSELGRERVQTLLELPDGWTSQHDVIVNAGLWRDHLQAYLACVSHSDHLVGEVLDALANSRYSDHTDVVLVSDNGYHLGEHLAWRKAKLFEEACRVPLLIRAPGRDLPAGDVDDAVSLLDVAPTICDLLGVSPPESFAGTSLLGGEPPSPAVSQWDTSFSEVSADARYRTTTHYVADQDGTLVVDSVERYDRLIDPNEFDNLEA